MPTIYYADGFDGYTTLAQAQNRAKILLTDALTPSTTYKRTGARSGKSALNGWAAIYIGDINNGNAFYSHFAVYKNGTGGFGVCGPAYWPSNYSIRECQVTVGSNGGVYIYRGGGTTELAASAAGKFTFNAWNHFIIKWIVHDSTGEITVSLNGEASVVTYSGDTKQYSNPAINCFTIGSTFDDYYDDLVISDTNLGDVKVITKFPDADSATNDAWTPSTGSDAYAMVDETTPNDDTDYISSTTSGNKSTWSFEPVGLTGTVYAVQLVQRAKKINTGTKAIRGMARVSSTDYEDTDSKYLASDGYTYNIHKWTVNPNTTNPWAVSEIDASEFGVKDQV